MTNETNWVDKECKETIYLTPDKILEPIRAYFGGQIPCDPATEESNPTNAKTFWTIKDNGLEQEWPEEVFVNPPYGKIIRDFTAKIREEANRGSTIIALLPCGARFSTRYWQNDILIPKLKAICFVKGRVRFLRSDGTIAKSNPYDSAIYGFNVNKAKFSRIFSEVGKTIKVSF